ncbi:sigma-70 family RNA polymerase sigma factor [Nocardia cyriacigeorgica]|uniref:sigma-70 family RNA polymerase sigma factor n=1 Tax=Nocardia cyriacigeorgica TaxID=135487 RepID=UPI0018932059|nr:sigma-70 family RNA polymerase sigma factor [Nocardia cyriacigeorgica]MBF6161477.1 sigma-70 family RNA polymerase sigma factor [Nocardia cyriacigeorgica]MBF6200098.1 sigma-70 family RNA polymerase sigma factor [Nocardia cyriacigeorgica]MBF6318610.1 sigma-70 family RNA polymerase sigma factor [Nocardia cyriacigeorgica]MBF6346586.1 sigma-70 family RNA polymerase sigma factor [Nocardia cyriacigeorgica]MBF6412000.1 sigma-70 family RNA polymerase sigma factor [Nocardia cyriacigeorgica]
MNEEQFLAERFQEHRTHLRSVAYRMLGSVTDADDAVQEAWLRLARTDTTDVGNLGGWLTTVVGRVCLDMLRSRKVRQEEPLENLPDPVVTAPSGQSPEQEAVLADSVGLALLVVLESLSPAERLAFVLHDMFAVPYEQIAPIVDRTPQTAKKLASQARRRIQGEVPAPDTDLPRQRRVVDAFLAAARDGEFEELVRILDPDVVLRADAGDLRVLRGRTLVGAQAETFHRMATLCVTHPAVVNGGAGLVNTMDGEPFSIMSFTVVGDRITAIDILSDRERLGAMDLSAVLG